MADNIFGIALSFVETVGSDLVLHHLIADGRVFMMPHLRRRVIEQKQDVY